MVDNYECNICIENARYDVFFCNIFLYISFVYSNLLAVFDMFSNFESSDFSASSLIDIWDLRIFRRRSPRLGEEGTDVIFTCRLRDSHRNRYEYFRSNFFNFYQRMHNRKKCLQLLPRSSGEVIDEVIHHWSEVT